MGTLWQTQADSSVGSGVIMLHPLALASPPFPLPSIQALGAVGICDFVLN